MPIIHDDEFGTITVRKTPRATQVRIRVAPNGSLRASMPIYAPLFLLKRLLKSSRLELRDMIQKARPQQRYEDGQKVGKSHTLIVQTAPKLSVRREGQRIVVGIPTGLSLQDTAVDKEVRQAVIAALRIEAKSYLPKRLAYIAQSKGFAYNKVRFSHAGSRWGSCSSQGTISLNIALMKLPFELIDYVLIHELAHTHHMNHSSAFWALVSAGDPDYKRHRALLKAEDPSI